MATNLAYTYKLKGRKVCLLKQKTTDCIDDKIIVWEVLRWLSHVQECLETPYFIIMNTCYVH